jgi:hypothetical protein
MLHFGMLNYIPMLRGCGIEVEILFVPIGQKDCSEKPEQKLINNIKLTATIVF